MTTTSSAAVFTHYAPGTVSGSARSLKAPPQCCATPRHNRVASVQAPRPPYNHQSRLSENQVAAARSVTPEPEEEEPALKRSKHDAPTASYMWQPFDPKASRTASSPPILYVDYRKYARPAPPAVPGTDGSDRSTPPMSHSSVASSPSSHSYTSLSSVTAASTSPRDRGAYSPRHPHAAVKYASSEHVPSLYRGSPPADRELQNTMQKLDLNVHGAKQSRRSPPWHPYSSESESSSAPSPTVHTSALRHGPADSDAEEWTRYAKPVDNGGSSATYTCLWPETRDGRSCSCGYSSKKHLVKRHVESKHLQIKPIICEVCGKGFSQRTNYSTHMNTHTGAAPHKCQYPGCEATFGDPARRHRHMKAVHNHIPSKRRTQSDSGSMLLDMSDPEGEDSA